MCLRRSEEHSKYWKEPANLNFRYAERHKQPINIQRSGRLILEKATFLLYLVLFRGFPYFPEHVQQRLDSYYFSLLKVKDTKKNQPNEGHKMPIKLGMAETFP